MLWWKRGFLRASGPEQIGDLNPAVGIKDSCEAFLLLILFPGPIGRSKHASDLRKYADGVN
jgi:hypothetical protein